MTFAAATLTFIDSLVLGPLSYAEHVHSVKPATLLNVYLPISALFDAVQIRTLWFIPFNTILAKLLTCALAFKVALTILEALPKRHVLLASTQHLSKEGTSGIYSRITFNWLNPLLRKGFRSILSSDNLLKLEERLYSETLESNLQEAWNASMKAFSLENLPALIMLTRMSNGLRQCCTSLQITDRLFESPEVAPPICSISSSMSYRFFVRSAISYLQSGRFPWRTKVRRIE